MNTTARGGNPGRALARKLALQALYRWQLNPCEWQDLVRDY
jgi:transcription termination factor NusB